MKVVAASAVAKVVDARVDRYISIVREELAACLYCNVVPFENNNLAQVPHL